MLFYRKWFKRYSENENGLPVIPATRCVFGYSANLLILITALLPLLLTELTKI